MEPNGQVLQPVEILFIFGKRTPDTPDDMVWGQMVWYGMVWYGMWHGIGMSVVWYGFFIPRYGGIGMELIYHLGMGYPQGTLNQGIDVPYRYPKMGDWSDIAVFFWTHVTCGLMCLLIPLHSWMFMPQHILELLHCFAMNIAVGLMSHMIVKSLCRIIDI